MAGAAQTAWAATPGRHRADSLAATLLKNPMIAGVADVYRKVPVHLYVVAGIIFVVGMVLRVPLLLCLLGAGVFLSLPLVQGMQTDQIIRWGVVGSIIFLLVHHLVTSSRDRHL